MDSYSTLRERWVLFTFASFIAFATLIFFLNHSFNASSDLSLLQNIHISIAPSSQFPLSNEQFSAPPSNFTENVRPTTMDLEEKCKILYGKWVPTPNVQSPTPPNVTDITDTVKPEAMEKKQECNIYEGKWVYDPKARLYRGPKCPFISVPMSCHGNGRRDNKYEKWSWQPNGCEIPRFNATDMLVRLRGKKLIIVGDSLGNNQWQSLVCLIYSVIPHSRAQVRGFVFTALDYEFSVEFYWSPFLVLLEGKKDNVGNRILKLDTLTGSSKKWKDADIMVFNSGHWWMQRGKFKAWDFFQHNGKLVELELESAYRIAMKTWADWVDQNVDTSKTTVIFRGMSPEHLGSPWCYGKTQPMRDDEPYVSRFPKAMADVIETTLGAMKTPVKFLNITKLSQYRIDAHPSIYMVKDAELLIAQQPKVKPVADCSHWCLPGLPDTWNRLMYASMVLDSSSDYVGKSHSHEL